MKRMILWIMILMLILLAFAPALADSNKPTPEPLYIVLEPGQELYVLCASGLHLQAFGKQAGHGACDAAPTR